MLGAWARGATAAEVPIANALATKSQKPRRPRRDDERSRMATSATRHLRRRDGDTPQPTTSVELFFDLVFVFAITQLSHLILDDLSVATACRAAFLLLVVWWAWIYTTWMVNWFDPASARVR